MLVVHQALWQSSGATIQVSSKKFEVGCIWKIMQHVHIMTVGN